MPKPVNCYMKDGKQKIESGLQGKCEKCKHGAVRYGDTQNWVSPYRYWSKGDCWKVLFFDAWEGAPESV